MLASLTGTWPGDPHRPGPRLPLNHDPLLWDIVIISRGGGIFVNFAGTLDAQGRGQAAVTIPRGVVLPQAIPIDFAFVTLDATRPGAFWTSNTLGLVAR